MSSPFVKKCRPRKLEDVVGQAVTVQSLTNAFKANDLHHAYIFAGNLGCGKTSLARIMAAIENCLKKKSEPCGECDNCKSILADKSIDVKEIDAASNRGIDDIREIKKDAEFNPIDCKTKYYIIDEAHSLTGYAAEAALKLIEEPPAHVRFILCTTDPHLLKDTILSRCIFFKFNKVNWSDLYSHLCNIAKKEKLNYEEDALKIAAKAAHGSVRDALQNLQSISSYVGRGQELTYEKAKEIIGIPDERLYFVLINAITKIDVPGGMQAISELLKDGKDAREIIDGLQNHLRNLMIVLTCGKQLDHFEFMEDEIKRLQHQKDSLSSKNKKVDMVLKWLNLLYDVNKGIIINLDLQMLLEKFVVEAILVKRRIEEEE